MFKKKEAHGYRNPVEKISMKTLVYGEKTLLAEFRLEKGAVLPRHKHPHEQTGYLVSGGIDLTIGDATHHTLPGDSWSIPGDVEHNAVAREDSVAVEVFSPVRQDYIP
ncbi:MAG TPA: cupin domain-containing protein [Nitrospirota bacterium]|nr:cupin domain-containing protein [Nitrospirota bacterium]